MHSRWYKICLFFFTMPMYFGTLSVHSEDVSLPHIVFLNPSIPESAFFQPVTSIMKAAAADLGVELEVVYGNRSPITLYEEGKKIILRESKPDYLVLVNDKDKIPLLLKLAEKTKIKTVLFNGPLSDANTKKFTSGKEKLNNWIGGLLPNEEQAGFLVAKVLVEEARKKKLYAKDGRIHVVAINGNYRSHSPMMREKGLKRYLSENVDVLLNQIVFAYWSQEKAEKISKNLLLRYPQTSVIWSASDQMALGAIDGAKELGYLPGKNIISCGVDWLPIAFDALKTGKIACSVGGHIYDGAWLMILLVDHFNGKTPAFLDEETAFYVMDKKIVDGVKKILKPDFIDNFDFKQYSVAYNLKRPTKYGVHLILDQIKNDK